MSSGPRLTPGLHAGTAWGCKITRTCSCLGGCSQVRAGNMTNDFSAFMVDLCVVLPTNSV